MGPANEVPPYETKGYGMNAKEYWRQLQPREQAILLGGGVIAALLLLYTLVWDPFSQALHQLQQSVTAEHATLAWMQQASREVTQLRGRQSGGSGTQSLLTLVDETARSHGLGSALKKVEPNGQHAVRVTLAGAPFDTVLQWIETLTARGIKVTGFSADKSDSNGLADIQLSLGENQ